VLTVPYLPLDLDAKKNIPRVAKATGSSPGDIVWGLLELWEYVWQTKNDVVSELEVDGCFGPTERVRSALVQYEFLEQVDGGWRVRGAAKFLGVTTRQSAAGKVRAAGARNERGQLVTSSPSSSPPAGTPAADQLLHPTPNTQTTTTFAGATAPPKEVRKRPRVAKPPDPRHAPLREQMRQAYVARFREEWQFDETDAPALNKLLRLEADDGEVMRRWALAFESTHPPIRRVREFAPKWGHFVGTGPPRSASAPVAAQSTPNAPTQRLFG
jgi:hypothetical protein